ncbi:LOW QUALITY PROTEIN: transmembrane protein 238-like, partial [Gracilinanus agilis]|uniref:LOW QUALITY PROTEIN: transmembrane protein 238-like n=1 Tax=Gracilinanus agilis TaxID=191870 RepID=UPI001CFC55D0
SSWVQGGASGPGVPPALQLCPAPSDSRAPSSPNPASWGSHPGTCLTGSLGAPRPSQPAWAMAAASSSSSPCPGPPSGAAGPLAPAARPSAASSGLGRCRMALLLAVGLDVAGMVALLTGVFAHLQVQGRDFGDLLIYTGALMVFLSLLGWIFWYTGNIEISRQELERDYGRRPSTLARLARKLSRRWSSQPSPGSRGRARGTPKRQPQPSRRVRLQLGPLEASGAGME